MSDQKDLDKEHIARADAGTAARKAGRRRNEGTTLGFNTRAIHAGYEPDSHTGAINVPIYTSTTFAQNDIASLRGGYEYARVGNPTSTAVEDVVASLEGGSYGRAFASGMAATDTVLRALLAPGKHMIIGNDVYGGTFRLLDTTLKDWGVEFSIVDTTKPDEIRAALREETGVVWLETPTNPLLSITDIQQVAEVLEGHSAKLVVDNTFATPYLQRPLDLGADVVVHSTTKYLGGHSDVLGGVVVTNDDDLDSDLLFLQGGVGAVPGPFDAYLVYRGTKTLGVRMDRHCSNAQAAAEFLDAHEAIHTVYYPGLATHPGHEIAKRQMNAFGGMLSVSFHGGEKAAQTFCRSTKLICLAESLGGVESLLEQPAAMTHLSAADSQLAIPNDLVRISIGIEDEADIINDLQQALEAI